MAFIKAVFNYPSFPLIFQKVYCFLLSGLSLKGLLIKVKPPGDASTTLHRERLSIYAQHAHWAVLEEKVPVTLEHRVWAAWPHAVAGRQLSASPPSSPAALTSQAAVTCR